MTLQININNTSLSVNRMFKFATASNKTEATEMGPVDTFMDGMKSLFRGIGLFAEQTKKEKLEQAYDEFRNSLCASGIPNVKGEDIPKGNGSSVVAFKDLAELSAKPEEFKIVRTNAPKSHFLELLQKMLFMNFMLESIILKLWRLRELKILLIKN